MRVIDGFATRTVTIDPAVGGAPTSGFAWTVSVGAKGVVQQASGWLATPEPAGTYPLIGVQEGFERLKKFRPLGAHRPGWSAGQSSAAPRPAGAGKVPCTAPSRSRRGSRP